MDLEKIDITNFADGAIVESFDSELKKVTANIADLSTKSTEVRKITITVTIKPVDNSRQNIMTSVQAKSTLAPTESYSKPAMLVKELDPKGREVLVPYHVPSDVSQPFLDGLVEDLSNKNIKRIF